MTSAIRTVAVFGSSRREENSPLYAEAYQLGRLLAQSAHSVLTGGYDGSMAAVSRGAAEAGGQVIGVTCAVFDPLVANRWLTEEIKAPDLLARLTCMLERADAFVALRGGIGTLSEVTLAWSMLQAGSLQNKPLILLGRDWQALVGSFRAHTDIGTSIAALAQVVFTPTAAVAALAAPPPPTPPSPRPLG